MGILKGIGLFLISLVLIGAIGGGVIVFFTLTEGIPFLKEKYQDLERFDDGSKPLTYDDITNTYISH